MSKQVPILVTGGAGFIGSHTCKALSQQGYLPVCFDNLTTGHADNVRWGPLVTGDVRDQKTLVETIKRFQISSVLHFAASAYVGESIQRPEFYFDNNVGGMVSLLNASVETDVRHIVLSSSCATYGNPARKKICETTPQQPINPYGRSKLICENMLQDCARTHRMTYIALRYFNAAGCDPDGELVERHTPETHLLPLAMQAAAGKRSALTVFGTDYPTRDGSCERDFIHVSDLANGHLLALRHLQSGAISTALNLGSGYGHTVFEVLKTIEQVTGHAVPYSTAPRRAGDPASLTADPHMASQILGFRCKRSSLKTIIRDAAAGFGLRFVDRSTSPNRMEGRNASYAAQ